MKIISSYKLMIKGVDNQFNNIFKETIQIYRKAVKFYINVINNEWDLFKNCSLQSFTPLAETLTHKTNAHPNPKYDFDTKFYKVPCYFRRNAIASAFGIVSSYKSNYSKWEAHKNGEAPKLQYNHECMPSFYYKNMYEGDCFTNTGKIKVFNGTDWVWCKVDFRNQDIKYLQKYWTGKKAMAPTLEYRHKKFYLRFAFNENIVLNKTKIEDQLILSIDLGINTDATCSVMDARGTVHARKFINDSCNKDLLNHRINRIKKHQRKNGSKNVQSQWSYLNNLNHQISCNVAKEIIEFATLYDVDTIVFEHLNIRGSKSQRIHLWRKREIQQMVEHKAHRMGIHVYKVNPKNTSALAFDGSGKVIQNNDNYSMCNFTTGKVYNCDLSASYNIGARYFIKEILKPLPAKVTSELWTKVPELQFRTKTTLSTLIKLGNVLSSSAA